MSYLREAITKQRQVLINQLIQAGVYRPSDDHIYAKTISELILECKKIKEVKHNEVS